MKDSMGTVTDPAAREWAIADRVIQLRQWGTDIVFPLPASAADGQTLGASGECSLRLDDASGQISRIHARLERTTSGWDVRDLASKNGIQLDGAYRTRADHEWVRKFSASSLPDIEKGTRRLVAFRVSRNMSDAATRLRMAPVSLSRWLGRRQLPPVMEHPSAEQSRTEDAGPPRRRGRPARSARN